LRGGFEYGHELVARGRHLGRVEAKPFIRNSFDSSENAALAAIEETIAEEINKAAATLGAR
jgi:hypothetical protein